MRNIHDILREHCDPNRETTKQKILHECAEKAREEKVDELARKQWLESEFTKQFIQKLEEEKKRIVELIFSLSENILDNVEQHNLILNNLAAQGAAITKQINYAKTKILLQR